MMDVTEVSLRRIDNSMYDVNRHLTSTKLDHYFTQFARINSRKLRGSL